MRQIVLFLQRNNRTLPKKPLSWTEGRVLCSDLFEDWSGSIENRDGQNLAKDCGLAKMDDVRRDLLDLIDATPHLDWLLSTKYPQNIGKMLHGNKRKMLTAMHHPSGSPEANIWHRNNLWLGVDVSTQEEADKLIPELFRHYSHAKLLFVSVWAKEPINLLNYLRHPSMPARIVKPYSNPIEYLPVTGANWVIVGGDKLATRDIIRQCENNEVACFSADKRQFPLTSRISSTRSSAGE